MPDDWLVGEWADAIASGLLVEDQDGAPYPDEVQRFARAVFAQVERAEEKWEELRKVIHEGHRKEIGCVLDEAPYGPGCFGDTCIYAPPYEGTYAHALFCSCSAPEWPCSIIVDFDYIDLGEEAYEAKYYA